MKGIILDDDKTLRYETNSIFRKIANLFLIPVLNLLPQSTQKVLKKTHKSAKEIIEHATNYKAMEILYNRKEVQQPANFIQKSFLSIWLSTNNSKALRNRLRLVKREIKNKIIEFSNKNKNIKIASIGSGSARAILESLDEIPLITSVNFTIELIDTNHDAILYSKQLASQNKYKSSICWVNDTAQNFLNEYPKNMNLNIVEVVGILEYMNQKEIVEIFSLVYRTLEPGGVLITSNIIHNIERHFISKAVGWKMTYRSANNLVSFLLDAGFSLDKMKTYYEPQQIHCVVIATK